MKLAIVGSRDLVWSTDLDRIAAQAAIQTVLQVFNPEVVISGACPKGGVDIWAVEQARTFGCDVIEFPPYRHDWTGYEARNIRIAKACDRLVAIRSRYSRSYGSGWTADFAQGLGKPVHRIVL